MSIIFILYTLIIAQREKLTESDIEQKHKQSVVDAVGASHQPQTVDPCHPQRTQQAIRCNTQPCLYTPGRPL